MPEMPSGFLVEQRDDGFGDVHPLVPGQRYVAGRSPDNKIVVRDDLCSRRHAELFPDRGGWGIRDLGSLNGTAVNDEKLKTDFTLQPQDVVRIGRVNLLFVHSLDELPALPPEATPHAEESTPESLEIVRRLSQTKFSQQPAITVDATQTVALEDVAYTRPTHAEALSALYRLALDMAEAPTEAALAERVIDGLFRATPAEVGAVLSIHDGGDPQLVAFRTKLPFRATYHKVSQFVGREVLSSRQAVLAEDVAADRHLKTRESLNELAASSLICAPVTHDGKVVGLLHLYRTSADVRLNADDLELATAAAEQLAAVWPRVRTQTELAVENRELRAQLKLESELVGGSAALRAVEQQVARVAITKATVLIRGESGVGKELVARAIHFNSPRNSRPFVCLNCAALPETLLESELFGHEKGAFTGATERMAGKFEAADRGTVFLDEIGEMSLSTQAKFLRILEGHPFERVGGGTPITVDVRVVAATNRPLEDAVRAGAFRKDLYFRLQVVQLDVPPLRDRPDDVPVLAEHFLKRFARETGRKLRGFSPAAAAKLQGYHWPGNVRELKNVVERAVALGAGPALEASDIWLSPLEAASPAASDTGFEPQPLLEVEKQHILRTLEYTGWHKSQAATLLGIERSTLDRKIKSYGLTRPV